MKDHDLRIKVDELIKNNNDLYREVEKINREVEKIKSMATDWCTYCKKLVLKGKVYKTGETYNTFIGYPMYLASHHDHYACDECLIEFKNKCEAAKTGYASKKGENK